MLVLLGGCLSDESFGPDVSVSEAEAAKVRTRTTYDRMLATAMGATEGSSPLRGEVVRAGRCSEFADRRYVELEVGGTFLVKGLRPLDVAKRIARVWRSEGWTVFPFDGFELVFETQAEGRERLVGSASIGEVRRGTDQPVSGVGLSVGTGCLGLPDSLADSGWPEESGP